MLGTWEKLKVYSPLSHICLEILDKKQHGLSESEESQKQKDDYHIVSVICGN